MNRPRFEPPRWRKPAPLAYGSAIDAVGTVASPLLAGFSLASVIVVSDDSANFLWPGVAMLALTIAAVALIGAVKCSYFARQFLWSGADVRAWWPELKEGTDLEKLLRDEQALSFRQWEIWTIRTRIAYDCGILALLTGLGLALPPQHDVSVQDSFRWAASGVAFAACAGEICWNSFKTWRRSPGTRYYGK